jgi:hypothetical protein
MEANSTTYSTQLSEQPVGRIEAQGIEWARASICKHPEIEWLGQETVKITEEGRASAQGPYSEQLYGKRFIEVDRTLMTLRCLNLFLDGSDKAYEEFTAAQPPSQKLSRESFNTIHLQGKQLIHLREAMEAALVLGDMGKSDYARQLFKITAVDHDDFYEEAIHLLSQNPTLAFSFEKLSGEQQHLLINSANLAHFGHITHLEGGPNMFRKLKEKNPTAEELSFSFFVHTCDTAGAQGHVNNQSSLSYEENIHRKLQTVLDICHKLCGKSEQEAYKDYLALRAKWLGFNMEDQNERVLAKVGAMIRVFTPAEGKILKEAFSQLTPEQQEKIIAQLDILPSQELKRTPTYVPAVLVNLANNREVGLEQAVVLGLPFIADVLKQHKSDLAEGKANPDIPLNFNFAAGVAKTEPQRLKGEFKIESDGSVKVN